MVGGEETTERKRCPMNRPTNWILLDKTTHIHTHTHKYRVINSCLFVCLLPVHLGLHTQCLLQDGAFIGQL